MKLKSVYSSSRFVEMTNNTIIQHQQSQEREKCYTSNNYEITSPFYPTEYESGKKKKPKGEFEIDLTKKTKK